MKFLPSGMFLDGTESTYLVKFLPSGMFLDGKAWYNFFGTLWYPASGADGVEKKKKPARQAGGTQNGSGTKRQARPWYASGTKRQARAGYTSGTNRQAISHHSMANPVILPARKGAAAQGM